MVWWHPRLLGHALVLLTACAPVATPAAPSGPTPARAARLLAAGVLDLPAARAFGDAGFHETLAASATVPRDLGPIVGHRLVLRLSDATRSGQTCASEHPLSGCATIDWSDDPRRPKVPQGGVFENAVTLRLASGAVTLFLRPSGALAPAPEPFEPG